MKRFIVRADDLGYSRGVNYGIYDCVRCGSIKNVGYMVNMEASQHGYKLIKDFDISLGLHVNVCVGNPVNEPEDVPSLVQDNGEFLSSGMYAKISDTNRINLNEMVKEIEAQYFRFVEITKCEPDYFEGHAIEHPILDMGLQIVAEKYGLKYHSVSFEPEIPGKYYGKDIYIHMESDEENYDPWNFFQRTITEEKREGNHLMVFHPGYVDHYLETHSSYTNLRSREAEMLCSERFKDFVNEKKVVLWSYKDLI